MEVEGIEVAGWGLRKGGEPVAAVVRRCDDGGSAVVEKGRGSCQEEPEDGEADEDSVCECRGEALRDFGRD